jgi:hypothetical protein
VLVPVCVTVTVLVFESALALGMLGMPDMTGTTDSHHKMRLLVVWAEAEAAAAAAGSSSV